MANEKTYDLIIVGAGPAGLEAALAAAQENYDFLLLEKDVLGGNVRKWGFVQMFSPLGANISRLGAQKTGISPEDDRFLTGYQYLETYMEPLSRLPGLTDRLHCDREVISISRHPLGEGQSEDGANRNNNPFRLLCQSHDGSETVYRARSVIDASGSYSHPRYLGSDGLPTIGERHFEQYISYDLIDIERTELSGPVLVVGDGHTACTTLDLLRQAIQKGRDLKVYWVTADNAEKPVYEIPDDPLLGRKALVEQANAIASGNVDRFEHFGGYAVHSILGSDQREQVEVVLESTENEEDHKSVWVNHIFAHVGYRPNRTIYEELHLNDRQATGAATGSSSQKRAGTGQKESEGDSLLSTNPEPNFYIIGAKSYGQTSNFLIRNCHEQIASVLKLMPGSKSSRSYAR